MKKFSDWMEDKGYDFIGYTAENTHIKPTPQMLVGYQLEYLAERYQSVLVNWGEDTNAWEVSVIINGERALKFGKTSSEALTKAIEYVEGKQ